MAKYRKYNSKYRKEYSKYNKSFTKLENRYGDPTYEKMTFSEFKRAYIVERERESSGEVKSVRNLSKKLAEDSFYDFSYHEARMIKKYAVEMDIEGSNRIKVSEIRRGITQGFEEAFYEGIRRERQTLFQSGLTKQEVRKLIGRRFFDSK